jgi:hypothetical protein
LPPALFHFGNSSAATLFGLSPAFNRLIKVEDPTFPQPSLNAHETKAPYWFSLSLIESLMSLEMHFSKD